MRPDGTRPRRLSSLKSVAGPAWSPDGRQIAFYLWRSPGGIWVINADGSGLRRLNARVGRVGVWSPAWSPAGDKIAFTTGAVDGSIYVINRDSSDQRRLTRRARTVCGIAWSPNGRKIVYEGAGGGGIHMINLDGTGERRVAPATGAEFGELSLSPDGRTIAYASNGNIYVMNADGSGRRQLTDTPEVDGAPLWSPKRVRR
jgi:Tol biopolymer transport system component